MWSAAVRLPKRVGLLQKNLFETQHFLFEIFDMYVLIEGEMSSNVRCAINSIQCQGLQPSHLSFESFDIVVFAHDLDIS